MKDTDKTKEEIITELEELRRLNAELAGAASCLKKENNALKESEDSHRAIVENVNIGVYRNTGGPHGRFLQANPAIAKMFGFESVEDFMTTSVSGLYQNAEDRMKFVEDVLKSGAVRNRHLRLKKKDGTPIWGSCTATAKFNSGGELMWIDGVIEDITEMKQAQEAKEKLIVELQVALFNVKTLSGLLPMCAWCKKIRNDKGYWKQVEEYISEHTDAEFSHGICPECMKNLVPETYDKNKEKIESGHYYKKNPS